MTDCKRSITITVDGSPWTLDCSQDDGEPRIRDLDLAEKLGYERPRKIRDLIQRLVCEGKFNDSDICPTVGQNAGKRGRPSTEYHLNEEQALYVIAKSETAEADRLLKVMIRVFVLARKGLLPNQQIPTQLLSVLEQLVDAKCAPMDKKLDMLLDGQKKDVSSDFVNGYQAAHLKRGMKKYGTAMAGTKTFGKEAKSFWLAGWHELRADIDFSGTGTKIDCIPASLYPRAHIKLEEMLRRAKKIDDLRNPNPVPQLHLVKLDQDMAKSKGASK